jgi:hypothetical protein
VSEAVFYELRGDELRGERNWGLRCLLLPMNLVSVSILEIPAERYARWQVLDWGVVVGDMEFCTDVGA